MPCRLPSPSAFYVIWQSYPRSCADVWLVLSRMNTAVVSPNQLSDTASFGGAIYASTEVTMTAINNVIVKNVARDAGTALYFESSEIDLPTNVWFLHNTISGNTGNTSSGAVTVGDSYGTTNAVLKNNIISGNTFGLDIKNPFEDVLDADFNCVWNNTEGFPGDFPVIADPKLTPEYYPQQGSPVIEAGQLLSGHPALLSDKDGVSRPLGTKPNIGAYESTRNAVYCPVLFRK